jgi:cytochrome c
MSSNNGMEINKIAAAILLAGVIGMVAGKASEFLYYGGPKHPGHEHEEPRGYQIEVTEAPVSGGNSAPKGPADISALYASADIEAGKSYFGKKCATCHTIEKGGANGVGPNLYGIMGHKIASYAGFSYSDALKKYSAESWNFENMNAWQYQPRAFAPGTIMAYAGNPKDQERANLIAYLNSMSDSKLPYPKPKAAAK